MLSDKEQDLIRRACRTESIIAVVGASNDPSKYGYRIYRDLKDKGYKVYPVNNSEAQIQGDAAYSSISDLPEKPDVVNIVTPPSATEKIVEEAVGNGVDIIWMQPGAESAEAIRYAERHGVNTIHNTCIMVESSAPRSSF